MAYTRKTIDCWRFYLNYGQGWEHEITRVHTHGNERESQGVPRELQLSATHR